VSLELSAALIFTQKTAMTSKK